MRISQRQLLVSPNWQVSYYGYDGGGSVRQLTDPTGVVTDTYAYDAFGNTVAQTGTTFNQFLYRGEQFDSTLGMYYLRARYYRPQVGRFLTADKYEGEEVGACDCTNRDQRVPLAGTHHLFEYSNADPVSYLDPSGMDIFSYSIRVRDTVLQFAIHAAHHSWDLPLIGTLYCVHIQLLIYTVGGATGNEWRPQIPLPWCARTPF